MNALNALTRNAIARTLKRFCKLGREEFFSRHQLRFRRGKTHFICYEGRLCDLKAIVYVALGYCDVPANQRKFSTRGAVAILTAPEFGFDVVKLAITYPEYESELFDGTIAASLTRQGEDL